MARVVVDVGYPTDLAGRVMDSHAVTLQPGDAVTVQAFRADGVCYRWWPATVAQVTDAGIVTRVPSGTRIEGLAGGGWIQRHNIHGFYWFDRPYNLLEVYRTDGALEEVYIHIASPARLEHGLVRYTDHELDVVMRPGEEPRVEDEEDFVQAALAYGYTPDFQAACRAAVVDALRLAAGWTVHGFAADVRDRR